jgi:GT2 family glycosyltransferase
MKYECDIILLSYESPDLLKQCVMSVLEHTHIHTRLIVVDNASRDPEVASFIHALEGNEKVAVEKVFSDENSGFAAGMNKGMKISDAPYVCLLNNDCIVTDGWLEEMILVAETSSRIGIVNPQSNTFGSRPPEGTTIDSHALQLRKNGEKYVEMGHAIGFACLIKREVIDRIGYLDEIYRGVCYEDSDFSVRAQQAGFISVIAEGAYVFHHEQASRKKLPGKEAIYAANKRIFEQRWGKFLRIFILDPGKEAPGDRFSYYELLKGLARERAMVEVWASNLDAASRIPDGIREGILIKHADISLKMFPARVSTAAAMWRALTKKKRYDAVIIPKKRMKPIWRALRSFLRTEILAMEADLTVIFPGGRRYSLNEPSLLASALRNEKKW